MFKLMKKWGTTTLAIGVATLLPKIANATITNFVASNDSTTVSYRYTFSGTPTFKRVYLDTDRNAGTGYALRGIGADFMIENGNLFRFSGSGQGWAFTVVSAATINLQSTSVSWVISRSAIGSPSVVSAYANTSNNDFSPVVTQTLSSTAPAPTTTTVPASTVTWTRCATEGGTCSFTGTRQVRYGANGVYAYQTATGSISCTNGIFGDPVVGTQKFCDYSSVVQTPTTTTMAPPPPTTIPPTTVTWTRCATEGGTCSFTGTRQVRYGANGVYAYQTATGSISCTNGIFGDPLMGTQKFCDYSSVVQTTPPPTTTVPSQPPTTTTVPTIPPSGSNTQVSYSASSAIIANPERGFYHDINCIGGTMDVNQLRNYRINEGITLIHCYNQINAFVNAPLSSSVLSLFDSNLAVMRSAGVKTVIRFVYSMRDDGADATLSMMKTHLDQLAPYFSKNKDVIATVQLGFIGSWGEWANSQHFGVLPNSSSQNWIDRKALIEKILTSVPADRTVQIRFPWMKTYMYGSSALSSTEAFTGTARARIGHHNDCFLANSNDVGTYNNRSVEIPYLAEETKYLPIGGETCAVGGTPRTDCTTAQNEMATLHWSYLNLDFYAGALDRWRSEGCFNTIKAKMGYRFVLTNGSFSSSAKVGGSINVSMNIQNQGYASPYNARGLELILRNSSTGAVYRVNLNSDPRRWLPGTVTVQQTVALPANLPAGTYQLLLNLPDPATSLYGNPAYSIQLSNTNMWESGTGFNNLNATVVVSQ